MPSYSLMPRFAKDLLFLAFLTFIIVVIVTANNRGTLNILSFLHQIPHFDKAGHFILMGLLAFLALMAFIPRMKGPPRSAIRKIITILLVLIALEEGSQAFNPNRTFSIPDYLFSVAGVLATAWTYSALSGRKKKECQNPDTL